MSPRITVDREVCDGYGNCVFVAPKYFDLDDENRVVVLIDSPDEADFDVVDTAVVECPTRAIEFSR